MQWCNTFCNNVVLQVCSYRGYGLSQGKPTEAGLKQDAQASLDYLITNSTVVDKGNVSFASLALDRHTSYSIQHTKQVMGPSHQAARHNAQCVHGWAHKPLQ